jgi:hypothetical protein
MAQVNPNKVGMVLGVFLGAWHLLWSIFVAFGWAQPLINFAFSLHFIMPAYTVGSFDTVTALMLIVITGAIGYVVGFVVATIWNKVHQQ